MANEKKNTDKVWLGLAFYIAYFAYFISYAYEISYIVSYKHAYILLFGVLVCSFSSVLFASVCFALLSFFLITVKAVLETTIFIKYLKVLEMSNHNYIKWFFYSRIVITVLFIVLLWKYVKYLKSEKNAKLEEMRIIEEHVQDYNDKMQEQERNRIASQRNPVLVPVPQEVAPQTFYQPNQMNMTNGHYYQVPVQGGVPVNNQNVMYTPSVIYYPNNMTNPVPYTPVKPVALPIPTRSASITLNPNQNKNSKVPINPYVQTKVNEYNHWNAFSPNPHEQ